MTDNHLLLYCLAEIMLDQEQHILPVDLLFDDEQIGDFVKSIQIDSPYQQMLLEGVLTESVREEKLFVSFTVEGYFHYVLGEVIYNQTEGFGAEALKNIVISNKLKGAKEGVEQCLIRDIPQGNLERLMWFIDEGPDYLEIYVKPLLECLKTHGSKDTLDKILANPTDPHWEALFSLDTLIEELQLHSLRKTLLQELMPRNGLKTKTSLWLGLKAIQLFDKAEGENYLNGIDPENPLLLEDDDLLKQLGLVWEKLGSFDMAIHYFEKVLAIKEKNYGNNHLEIAKIYNNLGYVWKDKRNYIKAIDYHEKSLGIKLKILGAEHEETGKSYNNLGNVWKNKGSYNEAVEFFEKSFDIFLKAHGNQHPVTGASCLNLGLGWNKKGEFDKALAFLEKSLKIFLNTYGNQHTWTGFCFNNLGNVWKNKGDYDKAIQYYEKALKITLEVHGDKHPSTGNSYNNLGIIWKDKEDYANAIEYYEKALAIRLKVHGDQHSKTGYTYFNIGSAYQNWKKFEKAIENYLKGYKILTTRDEFPFRLAKCYESLSEFNLAIKYFVEAAEIRKDRLGQEDTATIEVAENALRLAKSLKEEATLPTWIRVLNN